MSIEGSSPCRTVNRVVLKKKKTHSVAGVVSCVDKLGC